MIGDRYTFWVKTAAGSDTPIQLHPDWGYSEIPQTRKTFYTTQGGQLNINTLVSSWIDYSLPIDYITSQDAWVINSWWSTNTQLHFTINTSVTGLIGFTLDDDIFGLLDKDYNPLLDFETYNNLNVRISNTIQPFNRKLQGMNSVLYGNLNLTTVN